MAIKYYKKLGPENKPVLGNNTRCEFTTLDGLVGYFATDNPYVQGELDRFITEGRYGLSEIQAEEFVRDYIEKKKQPNSTPLKPVWREEIGPSKMPQNRTLIAQIGAERVAEVVGLVSEKPATIIADPPPAPPKPAEYKPSVARRARRNADTPQD